MTVRYLARIMMLRDRNKNGLMLVDLLIKTTYQGVIPTFLDIKNSRRFQNILNFMS